MTQAPKNLACDPACDPARGQASDQASDQASEHASNQALHFQVNQIAVAFTGHNNATVLSVLRDELALSGPKFGCGQGDCGACMVLVDGTPQTACNLPVWAVQGKHITTLEGLGSAACPHPVQTAFVEGRAAQCGYCVAGIITSAAALLQNTPQPTRPQIVQALEPHLCRCGAHNRMVAAVQRAAALMATPVNTSQAAPPSPASTLHSNP